MSNYIMPESYNFPNYIEGTTFHGIQIKLIDDTIDLTGSNICCQFRQFKKDGDLIKDLSIGNGITITDAVKREFEIDEFELTDEWAEGRYYYDIKAEVLGIGINVFLTGGMNIIKGVSQCL